MPNSISSSRDYEKGKAEESPILGRCAHCARRIGLVVGVLIALCLLVQWQHPITPLGPSDSDTIINIYPTDVHAAVMDTRPDFDEIIHIETLGSSDLDFDNPSRRIITIGDIHGRIDALTSLLSKLAFNTTTDTLVFTGDILTKGPSVSTSLASLDLLLEKGAKGVRGNHDQKVLGWWLWREWILSHGGRDGDGKEGEGKKWLEELESGDKSWEEVRRCDDPDLDANFASGSKSKESCSSRGCEGNWRCIPSSWKFMDKHYAVARSMNSTQASFLRSLPLILHIPRLHSFVVHAGLLPVDFGKGIEEDGQPLSTVPSFSHVNGNLNLIGMEDDRRGRQERNVLEDVPDNRVPWNVLNLRSILNDYSLSKKNDEGWPWAMLWNAVMDRCVGFPSSTPSSTTAIQMGMWKERRNTLPCNPMTIIYGHAASRGLSIERWTKGLDSGCTYGRRLTALVLTPSLRNNSIPNRTEQISTFAVEDVRFGDEDGSTARAHLVSVACEELDLDLA